jgi:hypothetical protein
MPSVAQAFECDKLIRFHHCDPAGIVFYPQYFVLFNELVEDWFNQGLAIDFARLHVEDGIGIPMGSIECKFSVTEQGGRDPAPVAVDQPHRQEFAAVERHRQVRVAKPAFRQR